MDQSGRFPIDVTEHIQEGVLLLDAQQRVAASNRVLQTQLGSAPAIGATIEDLIAQLGPGAEALRDLRPGERVVIVASGRLLECRATGLDGAQVLWCCRDCSEELRLHAQIAEQGHVLASSNEACLVVDRSGTIRYANSFCERERGYETGAMVGLPLADIERGRNPDGSDGPRWDHDILLARLHDYAERGGVHRYEAWHYRADGSRFPTSVSLRPYRLYNELVLLMTASDESERLEFVRQLVDARARAEESSRAKSAFLAVTSHELRTPLTAIIGFCELLQLDHGEGAGDLPHYLRLIHNSSRDLLRLINDIIDFAKIEGRTLRFDMQRLDPDGLLEELVERWQLRCDARGLELRRQTVLGEPAPIHGDAQRIGQLLDNLVGNACKFTSSGAITVALEQDERQVVFRVSDTGRGISPAARERIFEPFFQEEDSTTRKGEGTGLGLYICRTLSRLLGGDIVLERTGPDGSCFAITLPRSQTLPGQSASSQPLAAPSPAG